ncbi:MAG: DUF4082 domain-containing protein [Acidobacteriota bacterium]
MRFPNTFLALALALAAATAVSATPVAYEFITAPTSLDDFLTLGFQFTPNAPLTVTSLGYYDEGGDGLLASHEIGIFDAGGNLLASATVGFGTAAPLIGNFRYVPIAPLTLSGSLTYTIAATTGGFAGDPWAFGTAGSITGLTVNPLIGIAPDAGRYIYPGANALVYPTNTFTYTLYAGPNFGFESTAVPEPGTFVLLGLTLLPAIALARRFRRT